jgi:hypothetical protein
VTRLLWFLIQVALGCYQLLRQRSDALFTDSGTEIIFSRGLTEGTVAAKVLSSRNRREKEDRTGESEPF